MSHENPYKRLSNLEVCKRYILSILDSYGNKNYGAADTFRTEIHTEICRRLNVSHGHPAIGGILWELQFDRKIYFSFPKLRRLAEKLDYDEWRPIREKARDTYGEALYNFLFVKPKYCTSECWSKLTKEGFCLYCDLVFTKAKRRKKMINSWNNEIRERVFANVKEEDKDYLYMLDTYNSAETFWNFVLEKGLCTEFEYKLIKNNFEDLWNYVGE